jgi:hypothetical protein
MGLNLRDYFPQDVADDLQKNLVIKIIMGTKIRHKKELKQCITSLQVDMFLDDMGIDWFDYGFVNNAGNNISITFYKVNADMSKSKIDIALSYHDAVKRDTKHILGVIRSARNHIGEGWA